MLFTSAATEASVVFCILAGWIWRRGGEEGNYGEIEETFRPGVSRTRADKNFIETSTIRGKMHAKRQGWALNLMCLQAAHDTQWASQRVWGRWNKQKPLFTYVWISNTACIIKDNGTATVGYYGMRTTKQRQKNIGGFIQSNASLHRLIVQLLNFQQLIQCVVYCIVYCRWMYYMCERVRACGTAHLRRILFWDLFLFLGRMIWPLTFLFSLSK